MIVRQPIGLAIYNYTTSNPIYSGKMRLGIVRDGEIVCIVRASLWPCGSTGHINCMFINSSLRGIVATLDMETGFVFNPFRHKTIVDHLRFCFLSPLKEF